MKIFISRPFKFSFQEPTKEALSEKLFQLGHEHELMVTYLIWKLLQIEVIAYHLLVYREI